MSVDIKFDDKVQALLLFSSLPESWPGTVTAVSGSTETTKLKFNNIREDKCRGRKKDRGRKQNRGISKSKKRGGYMEVRDYDDAVCCVENTVEDRIMDSGASFHATFCKEELEMFRLRSGKVRLADDKTLDIAGIKDVVLKTSFGTSWTLKDVRYIPGLKKRLISVGQLDEEGYHVGFGDQQWKVTKGSLVVARGNKRGSLYMVEVPSDGINAAIDGRGNATLWHQRLGYMSEKGMKILASKGRIPDLQKAVVGFCEPCVLGKQNKVNFVKFGNTRKLQRLDLVHTNVYGPTSFASIGRSRYYVTFIDDSNRKVFGYDSYVNVKDVARDKLDAKSVKCTFIGYGSDKMGYRFWDSKSHKIVRSRDFTFNEDPLYGDKNATYSSNLTKPNHKDQVVLEDSPENLANKSIVAEHVLSSEITQSPSESSDTSEGSENSESFKDSGRSSEKDSDDGASSEEEGSETPQVQRSNRESRAPVRYSPSANYLLLTESYSEVLSSKESVQWKKVINEEISSLKKNQTWSLVRLNLR
ncbi:retrovirus-related pol polyprotein from transposon TNT 1-94 [Tanacetum coccineum]|uniref:Retrovirus-related pol polyprotein from transposon TNT 1-94 n=1 Tax=Tanacetum coccineum TaxID=301880 RepID=A0ABQ5I334_9ASTR